MAEILGEILTYENTQRRPLLSAIVVHKYEKVPGEGFFTLARRLGHYSGQGDLAALTYFVQEATRVHSCWTGVHH